MKFKVFPYGVLFVIIIDILFFLGILLLILFCDPAEYPFIYIFNLILFTCFPITFSIDTLLYSFDYIIITDKNIKKYHFGKIKKIIDWNDVKTASVYPHVSSYGWIYISDLDVKYNFFTSSFMMFGTKTICVKYSNEIVNELNKHLPETKKIL